MSDSKLLKLALEAGWALERTLKSNSANETLERDFVRALEACATDPSPLVQKLAALAPKVSIARGEQHLLTLLVPLERLAGRTLRDEEFLFAERDGVQTTTERTVYAQKRIVICENIRSAFNVGAIFRTAETFAANAVWLAGYTPDPLKTAMGADALIKTNRFERTQEALKQARSEGFKIVVLENSPGAVALESFSWPDNALLVLGNERFGVDSQTLAEADHVVKISVLGEKNSLNVGVAFGVAASRWRATLAESAATKAKSISPIGYIRGGYTEPQVAPRQGSYSERDVTPAVLELESRFDGRPSNFSQALKDLDGMERIWILFGFHKSQSWLPQVRPPRGDGTKRGLFATRSPHRPNGLGLTCARLLNVDGLKLTIDEHDLLEGTPVYDIKPYVPEADAFVNAKAGWIDQVSLEEFQIEESKRAKEKLDWLEAEGETRLRGFIREQLSFQPFDTQRKRVQPTVQPTKDDAKFIIAFRTWRVVFSISSKHARTLNIADILSGYSADEILEDDDPNSDKVLHRGFRQRFPFA